MTDPAHLARPLQPPRARAAATIAGELTLEAVSHAYGEVPSVRGVDLTVRPGEVLCLLGQSGCGKTTLLRLAAGVERPTSGRIVIGGREVAGPRGFVPPEQRGVGLVFQDYALFPHMTILANTMFGLKDLAKADAEREAMQALARVGMEAFAFDYPHELSGGQQQRVALARAVAPRPAVLLMDEPFSGLDRRLRDSVRDETLAVLRETRATSLVVTHDPEEAMRMGDRIALMRDGELVQVGTAEDLYRRPKSLFVAGFFTEIDRLELRAGQGVTDTPFGPLPTPGIAVGTALDVALRPTSLRADSPGSGTGGTLARIVSHRFLGEVDQIEIAVEGLDRTVKVRRRGGGPSRPGEDVIVSLETSDVLVFPKAP